MTKITNADNDNNKKSTFSVLNPDQKTLLLHSIARYLELNGFSKSLKKFRSEANIQKDDLKDLSYDLEEIFYKFLDKKSATVEEMVTDDAVPNEKVPKEKKSRKKSRDSHGEEEHVVVESVKETADKKKKKNKQSSGGAVDDGDKNVEATGKKNKKDSASENSILQNSEINAGKLDKMDQKKDESEAPINDATGKKKESSKKRKKLVSEEDASHADEKPIEKSKRIKAEKSKHIKADGSEEPKGSENSTELIPSADQHNSQTNGILENVEEKSAKQKTSKNKENGSAEQKTANRFQRVKVDEIVFSDERLQDNSYWAKDGADAGYGAKAQEILGQVKGRGFRHEKTKKKRGSYRGGQIDLQSHSVKFNYSDDE